MWYPFKEHIMNIAEGITLFEELMSLYEELKADGTLDKLKAAEATVVGVLSNPKAQDLLTKVKGFAAKL